MSGTSIATAAVAINAITVLRNMTVLPHPVAPRQNDAFVTKALQVRSPNLAGCDKIAHESKPLRSAAAAGGCLRAKGPGRRRGLPRVAPVIHVIVARAPEQTVFTRFIPPVTSDEAPGMWQAYYRKWESATRSVLDPALLEPVPALAQFAPPARILHSRPGSSTLAQGNAC
jgi:hypothetical protein